MKSRDRVRLGYMLGILISILGSFILYLSWPMLTGETIVLATVPVDPFDMLRGQYLTIRYEISTIPLILGESLAPGSQVYVQLRRDETGIWRYQSGSPSPPSEGTFVAGNVISVSPDALEVEYGIEQFFFEKGATIPDGTLTAEVKVSPGGRMSLSRLLTDGKPVSLSYRPVHLAA